MGLSSSSIFLCLIADLSCFRNVIGNSFQFQICILLTTPGLPDGLFSNQKSQFRSILEDPAMEDVGMYIIWPFGLFCGHLVYFAAIWVSFKAIWYKFSRFGIFFLFWYVVPTKSGNPGQHERNAPR
jgi:hypothetical protein